MGTVDRIVILTHKLDSFVGGHYLLAEIADVWREHGIPVTIQRGIGSTVAADLAILHVDCTVVPHEYVGWIHQFPRVINASVTDISKRHISTNLVIPGDNYEGPVIIKTNKNAAGVKDIRISNSDCRHLGKTRYLRDMLPEHWRFGLRNTDYLVVGSPKNIPLSVWDNLDVVVEKFLPERHEQFYCLRTWQFIGSAEINSLSFSKEPIIKSESVIRVEPAEVPAELRRIRQRLGFDYGKFDYAIVGGRVVLYDANRTPTLGTFPRDRYLPLARKLANGLFALL